MLIKFAELSCCSEYKISKDKYKATLPLFVKKMEVHIEMKVEILKVDHETVCIDFIKKGGDSLAFYEAFNLAKGYFEEIVDAHY